MALAVTLTVEELGALVRDSVKAELSKLSAAAPHEVLTLTQVAELLHRSEKTVMESLVEERHLPVHYISEREPRFRRSEVLVWLSQQPTRLVRKAKGP